MYYFNDPKNPISTWFDKFGKYPDFNKLDDLFLLLDEHLPSIYSSYRKNYVLYALDYVKQCIPADCVELGTEYFHLGFKKISQKDLQYSDRAIDLLLYLHSTPEGDKILKDNRIDLSKYDCFSRELLFNHYMNKAKSFANGNGSYEDWKRSHDKILEALDKYRPKVVDANVILKECNSLTTCLFVQEYDCNINQKFFNDLLYKLSIYFKGMESTHSMHQHFHLVDTFNYILSRSKSFDHSVGPTKDYKMGLYNFFNRQFKVPDESSSDYVRLDPKDNELPTFKREMKFSAYKDQLFRIQLYSYNPHQYINLEHKHKQKVNLKLSGKAFVQPEIAEQNLKTVAEERPAKKRNKI